MTDLAEGIAAARAERFWRWFANSQVTDADGKPQVLYHGTAATGIRVFKGNRGVAAHFAFDPGFASEFADSEYAQAIDNGSDDEYGDGAIVYPAYINAEKIFDPRNPVHRELIGLEPDFDYTDLELNLGKIKAEGFDAYYDFEGNGDHPTGIAVFRPEQIKSALGNKGDFDPTNPSIIA